MALAETIEKQVTAQHPELDLKGYIRLYAHDDVGNVNATYLDKGIGGLHPKWKGGKSYWIGPNEFPLVMDGGCAVVSLRYNVPSETLVSLSCNGDA